MKKLLKVSLLTAILLTIPVTVFAGGTPLDRAEDAGWVCLDLGDWHCFDPGDAKSKNSASINVKVYDRDGNFLGTEQIWRGDLYAGQPCPQDEILTVLVTYKACHHYAQ